LEGTLRGDHHPVLIRRHRDHITLPDRLAAQIEDEIEAALDAIPAAWGVTADGVPSAGPGPGAAVLPAAERLAAIPGVSPRLARAILAGSGSPGASPLGPPQNRACPSSGHTAQASPEGVAGFGAGILRWRAWSSRPQQAGIRRVRFPSGVQ